VSAIEHPTYSWRRVTALMLRHIYLLRRSPLRMIELCYWPFMNMLMWGFISTYLRGEANGMAQAAGIFLSAVILWEVLIRSNLGLSLSFMEELYSRNLGHLFISPLRPYELVAGCVLMSGLRTFVGLIPAAVMTGPLFGYSVFDLGLPLIAFFFMLSMFGWAFGMLMMGILIRWGLAAEGFAWAGLFIFMPLAGIYYPIAALPDWLEPLAWSLPTAYIFEGMRAIVTEGIVRSDYLMIGFALNLAYLALGIGVFLWMFRIARTQGLLLNIGQ
jgi:ABC-2 type transport system permease protein